ncbi:hypothetical protein Bca4012_008177 [Brassica carinata]
MTGITTRIEAGTDTTRSANLRGYIPRQALIIEVRHQTRVWETLLRLTWATTHVRTSSTAKHGSELSGSTSPNIGLETTSRMVNKQQGQGSEMQQQPCPHDRVQYQCTMVE